MRFPAPFKRPSITPLTARAWGLLAVALLLYAAANQTQVGWLYLMSNALAGVVLVDGLLAWGALRSLHAERTVSATQGTGTALAPPELHEDTAVTVTVRLRNAARSPRFALRLAEQCPIAPPDEQHQRLFAPTLGARAEATFRYATLCDRRGLHRFPPLALRSAGAFGLVRRQRALPCPTELLVLPAWQPLARIPRLEALRDAERTSRRVGIGTEVLGTRDFRTGDSPRQVHWRSTARTGRLVVREFADETEETLDVALDLQRGAVLGEGKWSSFEVAVRIAASLGQYAERRGLPLRLLAASPSWQPPRSPLSGWALRHLLARVEQDGDSPLETLLARSSAPLLVVLVSRLTPASAEALRGHVRRGGRVLALIITPDGRAPDAANALHGRGLDTLIVGPHDWAERLAERQ